MDKKSMQEKFDAQAQSPWFWLGVADNLEAAAKLIRQGICDDPPLSREPAHRLHGPLLMLLAFSLECRLKARCVHKGTPVAKAGKLTQDLKTHDLKKLAKMAGLDLEPGESTALGILTIWGELGRYPVTTDVERAKKPTGASSLELWPVEHDEAYESVLRKARAAV